MMAPNDTHFFRLLISFLLVHRKPCELIVSNLVREVSFGEEESSLSLPLLEVAAFVKKDNEGNVSVLSYLLRTARRFFKGILLFSSN